MNTLRISFLAALLSTASAYAGAAPHWTAAIGTGRASNTDSTVIQSKASGTPGSAHWTASIGTGRVSEASKPPRATAAVAGLVTASPHWTASIGTGAVSESNAPARSSAAVAARTRP